MGHGKFRGDGWHLALDKVNETAEMYNIISAGGLGGYKMHCKGTFKANSPPTEIVVDLEGQESFHMTWEPDGEFFKLTLLDKNWRCTDRIHNIGSAVMKVGTVLTDEEKSPTRG